MRFQHARLAVAVLWIMLASCTPQETPTETGLDVPPVFSVTPDVCPPEVPEDECVPLTPEKREALLDHLDLHIDESINCLEIRDTLFSAVSAGKWDEWPDLYVSPHQRGSYNPQTGRYSINSDYFERYYQSGQWRWRVRFPNWAYHTAGQTGIHETLHGPAWGLQHGAGSYTFSEEVSCWNN